MRTESVKCPARAIFAKSRATSNCGSEIVRRIETARHLVRSDILFCKDRHKTLKYVDEFPELKKKKNWRNSKRTRTHTSLSLYLSIRRCNVYFDVPAPVSLSLSLHLQTRFGSRSDPNVIQDRMFRQFKNVCMRACDRKYTKR